MPIDLSTDTKKVKLYNPKFFSKDLTGVGKKTGVLNEFINPANVISFGNLRTDSIHCARRNTVNGNVETRFIPLNILPAQNGWDEMRCYTNKNVASMEKIATAKNNTVNVYADICVHSLIHEITKNADEKSKKLHICYQVFVYIQDNVNDDLYIKIPNSKTIMQSGNQFFYAFTNNPNELLAQTLQELNTMGYTVDLSKAASYVGGYSVYVGVCDASEKWQTKEYFIDLVSEYFSNICNKYNIAKATSLACMLVSRMENENVPLDFYKDIYNSIQKYFPNTANDICKMNMNLRLNNTLNILEANKCQLFQVPTPTSQVVLKQNPPFSPEQLAAVTTREPLTLVQAGAGTGKSTVILGRIDYLVKCGVNPNDILVLSFTNAAANNILDRNPNVKSMTIASMIHDIYTANYSHELSSIETIMNSIEIYYDLDDDSSIAYEFYHTLRSMKKNISNGFTALNNFVEENYGEIIGILNTINQTCLELEIVICYQQIDNFREPANIQSKYLIIDEVQDNSVFEFVYTLKYICKHNAGLFIVGDCSQTLYEFRASNPKALNVLEGSGVFATYQLQVNYRSNQEILDFANVVLREIEANQYARIQLQANNLNPVTEQSFREKVNFSYHQLMRMKDLKESFPAIMMNEVKPYIDKKLANHEQIAFLAYTRNHIAMIQEALEKMYPDKEIASLVPDKSFNSTIFSDFIKKYWDELGYVPNIWIDQIIIQSIYAHLPYMTTNKNVTPIVQKMLGEWRDQNVALVHNWQIQTLNGSMTQEEFFRNLKQNLLAFEIRHNAIRQHLTAKRNELNKKKQNVDTADFVLSTIHSAKGLEFDNVVVLYKNDNSKMDEDKKRMYYVAFTRAMKSEFILAYDTAKEAKIENDYNMIVEALQQKTAPVQTPTQATISANVPDVNIQMSSPVTPVVIPYMSTIIEPNVLDASDDWGFDNLPDDFPDEIDYDPDFCRSDVLYLDEEEAVFAPAMEFSLGKMPENIDILDPSMVSEIPHYIDPIPPFPVGFTGTENI